MTAGSAWDTCGAPLVQFDRKKLAHALPVTVYHLERYVWAAGAPLDWDAVLPADRPRPPFWDLRAVCRLWAQRLTVEQAAGVATWLGGRLPTRAEWLAAREVWDTGRAFAASLRPADHGDERLRRLVAGFASSGIRRRSEILESSFGEFASEYSRGGLGTVSIMSMTGADGVVTQGRHDTYCAEGVGFCCVFDSDATETFARAGGTA